MGGWVGKETRIEVRFNYTFEFGEALLVFGDKKAGVWIMGELEDL